MFFSQGVSDTPQKTPGGSWRRFIHDFRSTPSNLRRPMFLSSLRRSAEPRGVWDVHPATMTCCTAHVFFHPKMLKHSHISSIMIFRKNQGKHHDLNKKPNELKFLGMRKWRAPKSFLARQEAPHRSRTAAILKVIESEEIPTSLPQLQPNFCSWYQQISSSIIKISINLPWIFLIHWTTNGCKTSIKPFGIGSPDDLSIKRIAIWNAIWNRLKGLLWNQTRWSLRVVGDLIVDDSEVLWSKL